MAYVSLYRKYRPQSFGSVVGQDHVTRTLTHAIEEERLHHAYLFTGPRGTGKTSTARILAKAINCEEGPTPEPCNVCEHCTSITQGSSVDVIELDMASHGGVDDARELRDRALFAPARARKKVYVLDEVHMASTAAFNALLKLIEEPPGHVLFCMATTDPQKVLPTILSRVQRLDLRRVSAGPLADHVRKVCADEGYRIEDGAVDAVVRAGEGSVRDTLSVLEQVLAYAGQQVSAEAVAQVLGNTPADRVFDAVTCIAERDLAGAFALVQSLLDEGHDLRRFTLDLVQHLRDLLVLQVAPDRPDLVDATDELRRRLQAQTTALPRETMLRAVDLLAATVAEQRQGSPRLPLELALAQLAVPAAGGDVAELADRLARLEAGAPTAAAPVSAPAGAPAAPDPSPARAEPPAPRPPSDSAESATSRDTAQVRAPDTAAETPASPPPAKETPLQARARARAEGGGAADAGPAGTPPDAAVEDPGSGADDPAASPAEREAASSTDQVGAPPQPTDVQEQGTPDADDTADGETTDEGTVDELALIERHWEGVLDLVKRRSRRCHAVFEPAVPVRMSRGILTLRYPRRYASFHAQNATKGEYVEALAEAVERACGLKIRLEAIVEGDDDRRRPQPPSLTPADARTPVLDDGPTSEEEEAEVREAELQGPAATSASTGELLARELDATLLEEEPPPEA